VGDAKRVFVESCGEKEVAGAKKPLKLESPSVSSDAVTSELTKKIMSGLFRRSYSLMQWRVERMVKVERRDSYFMEPSEWSK
jgi:hypothetical protein